MSRFFNVRWSAAVPMLIALTCWIAALPLLAYSWLYESGAPKLQAACVFWVISSLVLMLSLAKFGHPPTGDDDEEEDEEEQDDAVAGPVYELPPTEKFDESGVNDLAELEARLDWEDNHSNARHEAIRDWKAARRGFTLTELVIVIAIMIVLSALALRAVPALRQDQKVVRGAEQVQGWAFIAKQEAYRDQRPRGIRLVTNGTQQVTELQYVEQPEEFNGGPTVVPPNINPLRGVAPTVPSGRGYGITVPDPAFPSDYSRVLIVRVSPIVRAEDISAAIRPGDWLTFDVAPYTTHRIASLAFDQAGEHVALGAADGTPSAVPGSAQITAEKNFHVTRQPQPRAGEDILKLPKDVWIDLSRSWLPGANLGAGTADAGDLTTDIVFAPKGGLMGLNSLAMYNPATNSGGSRIVILWLTDPTGRNDVLVAISARTGLIMCQPPAQGPNPYLYCHVELEKGM